MVNLPSTLADIPGYYAQRTPDATAMECEGRSVTFAQLKEHTAGIAQWLQEQGSMPEDRVAILDKNSERYLEASLGVMRSGGVLVAVNYRLTVNEMVFILEDAGVKILFAGAEFAEIAEQLGQQLNLKVQIVEEMDKDIYASYSSETWTSEKPIQPEQDAIQLYTSGTTGLPKGVQSPHAAMLYFLQAACDAGWADYAGKIAKPLVCMPLYHVAGFNGAVFALAQGVGCLIHRDVDPTLIFDSIEHDRVTFALFVPAVIQMLVQHPRAEKVDFSDLDMVVYGASPIPETILLEAQRLFDCKLVHVYGLTENQGGGTYLPPEDHDPSLGKYRSVGKGYEGCEVRVVNLEGEDVPQGEVGEVLMRSKWLMRGYWKRDEANLEALAGGWLHSGDAGYFDSDGYLYIHDRIKEMIISGGENIYPAEIESALHKHPDILDAAVVGVPDEQWGEVPLAVVVLGGDVELDPDALITFLKTHIAGYKIPKKYVVTDLLPRNASGKLLRRVLRAPYWEGRDRQVS